MRDQFLALTSQTSDEMFRLMEMPKVRETVANNRVTFYELLESHGDKENMVKFGKLLQDYDYVVKLYLQVWPLTQFFAVSFCCEKSLICLEGKSNIR